MARTKRGRAAVETLPRHNRLRPGEAGCDVEAFQDAHRRYTVLMPWMPVELWDDVPAADKAGWHARVEGDTVRLMRLVIGPPIPHPN